MISSSSVPGNHHYAHLVKGEYIITRETVKELYGDKTVEEILDMPLDTEDKDGVE